MIWQWALPAPRLLFLLAWQRLALHPPPSRRFLTRLSDLGRTCRAARAVVQSEYRLPSSPHEPIAGWGPVYLFGSISLARDLVFVEPDIWPTPGVGPGCLNLAQLQNVAMAWKPTDSETSWEEWWRQLLPYRQLCCLTVFIGPSRHVIEDYIEQCRRLSPERRFRIRCCYLDDLRDACSWPGLPRSMRRGLDARFDETCELGVQVAQELRAGAAQHALHFPRLRTTQVALFAVQQVSGPPVVHGPELPSGYCLTIPTLDQNLFRRPDGRLYHMYHGIPELFSLPGG